MSKYRKLNKFYQSTKHWIMVEVVTDHGFSFFQMRLMRNIRESIMEDRFPAFIKDFMLQVYPNKDYPDWLINSLASVNVQLVR